MGEGRDYSVGKLIARPLLSTASLTKDHLVLEIDANGFVFPCTNTGKIYAVANRSTQDKVARVAGITQYLTGAQQGTGSFIQCLRSGLIELQLGSTNIAIKVGDRIIAHADDNGTVNGAADETLVADKYLTIGYAEEVKGSNVGGTVLVSLAIAEGGGP